MALSRRGEALAQPDPAFLLWKILDDLWDQETNPAGYVSLGVAENALMHNVLSKHIQQNLAIPNHAFTYGDGPTGSKRLKKAMSRFLTNHLKPVFPIESSHVTITNGCTTVIEHLSWALANPGDVFLLGQPHYGAFNHDLSCRFGTSVVKVAFGARDPMSLDAVQVYEDQLLACHKEGRAVAGIMLCHPHNPLGRCYPVETLEGFMRLCQKYRIHLISDEIYALSVFETDAGQHLDCPAVAFRSVLSIPTDNLIDPQLVHSMWGMSKDFGANGIRVGALVSRNLTLHASLVPVGLFSSVSSISDHVTCNILEDDAWTGAYIEENRRRLAEHHQLTVEWAKRNEISYTPGVNAAFFLWVNLGDAFQKRHPDTSLDANDDLVMDSLLRNKIFLASGKQFGAEKPGWYRIVFSNEKSILEEGLRRVVTALGS